MAHSCRQQKTIIMWNLWSFQRLTHFYFVREESHAPEKQTSNSRLENCWVFFIHLNFFQRYTVFAFLLQCNSKTLPHHFTLYWNDNYLDKESPGVKPHLAACLRADEPPNPPTGRQTLFFEENEVTETNEEAASKSSYGIPNSSYEQGTFFSGLN